MQTKAITMMKTMKILPTRFMLDLPGRYEDGDDRRLARTAFPIV